MTSKEEILVGYALALALHGEDSPEARKYAEKYSNDKDLWGPLTEVLMLYRQLKGS